jgi:CBS domain-containing protein
MALLVSHAGNQTDEWDVASEARLTMSAVVKDVMSSDPVSVTRDAPFKELAARLFEVGVSGFPVVDDGRRC